jgi:hypothetical protein
MASSTTKLFQTADGYLLELRGDMWSDNDHEFHDVDGHPIDDWGAFLDGEFVDERGPDRYEIHAQDSARQYHLLGDWRRWPFGEVKHYATEQEAHSAILASASFQVGSLRFRIVRTVTQ